MDPALIDFCGRIVKAASDPSLLEIDGAGPFPKHMCTWMSYAAGELLHENGFGVWEIQNAGRPDEPWRHDWLVQDDLYVDLTAHQFKRFDTHIIGVGTNPVTEIYPVIRDRYPTHGISNSPPIMQYKERLGEILERDRRL